MDKKMSVRVRIAPSPTGDPHVGTAYVAIFNWLFAKKHGGKFILRIEDTDQTRSHPEYENQIIKALNWLGINWDEGPDIGGEFGPYRQSLRSDIYKKYAYDLLEKGHAYRCFATSEELELMRKCTTGGRKGYDRRYRYMDQNEIDNRMNDGQSFVIRLKVPTEGICSYTDLIRGNLTFPYADVDDQIILKSDGMPTYHLANVVDDHLMKITHVLRGDEWISSTPKHVFLYEAFGWTPPKFAHLPLLLGADGKKLSKRKSPTSILFYKDSGFLPTALVNFLMLIGHGCKEEVFTIDEICNQFDLTKIGTSGAFFDIQRLKWLNQHYINNMYSDKELLEELKNWFLSDNFFSKIIPIAKSRIKTFSDFINMSDFLFSDPPESSLKLLLDTPNTHNKNKSMIIQTILWELDKSPVWSKTSLENSSKLISKMWDFDHKKIVMQILFISLTGKQHSLPLFDSFEMLGKHRSRARLLKAIDILGGLSNKDMSKLEKAYIENTLTEIKQ